MRCPLLSRLDVFADRPPQAAWWDDGQQPWTWERARAAKDATVAAWAGRGIGPTDRLLLEGPLGPGTALAWWAAWEVEAAWTLAPDDLTSGRIELLAATWAPRAVLTPANGLERPDVYRRALCIPADPGALFATDAAAGEGFVALGWHRRDAWTRDAAHSAHVLSPGARVGWWLPPASPHAFQAWAMIALAGAAVYRPPPETWHASAQPPLQELEAVHLTAAQAAFVDWRHRPAALVGWIHGPAPAWVWDRWPWLRPAPPWGDPPTPIPVPDDPPGYHEHLAWLAAQEDPDPAVGQAVENAVRAVPGVVEAVCLMGSTARTVCYWFAPDADHDAVFQQVQQAASPHASKALAWWKLSGHNDGWRMDGDLHGPGGAPCRGRLLMSLHDSG